MKHLPKKLQLKLKNRVSDNSLRTLKVLPNLVDFSSNDYLGFATSEIIFNNAHQYLIEHNIATNSATGSRLLSGNSEFHLSLEKQISSYHNSEAALLFNSGYDANLGVFSSVLQRRDIVLYDEFCHASIRDGIRLSNAKAFKFKHNNLTHLKTLISKFKNEDIEIYVVTESVFSMDGDSPELEKLVDLCSINKVRLIIDEAHSLGVQNPTLIQKLGLEDYIFARIITFGKALGAHGAAVLCTEELKHYLINFSRSFIYTTALPPHSLATIKCAYEILKNTSEVNKIQKLISNFKRLLNKHQLTSNFINSDSAIQCCIISGNDKVKLLSKKIQQKGFLVQPILHPTVPKGQERLRICLHSYNSVDEISEVLSLIATFVKE